MFRDPDRAVMEVFRDIVNSHPDFMKINSTKSGADPFLSLPWPRFTSSRW